MSIARARKTADEWLERLELGNWKTKKVEELYKGMQQKAQFIAAVLHRPRLLILDEPFSGMDPVNQDLFKDVILDLNRGGATILFSTHQMETAEKLCRHIVLINGGKVVLSGLLASIKMGFGKNSVQMEFDGDGAFLRTLPGVLDVDDYGQYSEVLLDPSTSPQALLQTVVGRLRIRRFEQVSPSLHNIFIDLVKGERANA
jgi:ABC-2 type transport system ATP-binding protein